MITILISFVAHTEVAKADTTPTALELQQSEAANIYSGNPFEDGEESLEAEGGKKPDSVKMRIIKPLESYFFSDSVRARRNFKWNINPSYNRIRMEQIDTMLNNWNIDYPFYKEGVGDIALGGLGQATEATNFFDRANSHDFSFAEPYDAYTFTVENAPFYNAKTPMLMMKYLEAGQKTYRETNFSIMHAQNIRPSTGFAVEYNANGTKGQYQRQDTKNHNLAVTAYHTGRRYSVFAGYLNNTIKVEESGGVVGTWTVRDSLFEMPIGIPTKLGDAEASNTYRNNTIFVQQSYGLPLEKFGENDFSLADKSAVYVGHSISYTSWSRVYKDTRATYTNDLAGVDAAGNYVSETYEYYENWYLNPDNTRDSIRERVISNKLFLQAQPWGRNAVVSTVDGGIGFDLNVYKQFGLEGYVTGELQATNRSSWYAYGSASGAYKRYLNWNGEIKVYPSGYRAGDMSAGGDVRLSAYIRNRPISLVGSFKTELQEASFWEENLVSNHFVFQNSFDKQHDTRFEAKLLIPALHLELGASELISNDMLYYDTNSIITQESGTVSLTSVYLRKKFQIAGLNLDHRILGQWSSNEVVAPVPQLSVFLSYYYDFWAVKDVLRLRLGVDGRYNTSYYMPSYNPAISAFFNQRDEELGDYPYLDAVVTAKWKRMRIFVKYQHANMGWLGNGEYFQVAGYPLNPSLFKFGFSWGFYD